MNLPAPALIAALILLRERHKLLSAKSLSGVLELISGASATQSARQRPVLPSLNRLSTSLTSNRY
jgi:hypothetical protein